MSTRWLSDQFNSHVRIATLQQLRKAGKLEIIVTYSSPSNSSSAIVLLEFSSLNQSTTTTSDSLPMHNHHESVSTLTTDHLVLTPLPQVICYHGSQYQTQPRIIKDTHNSLLYLAVQSNYNMHYHCRQCIFRRERNVPTSNIFHSTSNQVEHR